MGKKSVPSDGGVNKTQAIKDALAKDPHGSPSQLAAALTAKGIEVSAGYVSTIKTSLKSQGNSTAAKPATRRKEPVAASAPTGDNGLSKSQAIRDALASNPDATAKQVANELTAAGLNVTPNYVRIIKSNLNTNRLGKKPSTAKTSAARTVAPAPASASSQTGNGTSTLQVTDLVNAKSLVDQVGGIEKAQQLLALLKKLQ